MRTYQARRAVAAPRVALVSTVALLALVVGPDGFGSVAAARTADATPRRCNGSAVLCEVPLGDVAFATTHNSMASTADGFRPPNQATSMATQLRAGIRGFQIDAYEGFPRGGRVYTDVAGSFGDVATDLPRTFVRSAEAIHRRLGAPPPGTPSTVHLCHTFCELGAVRMDTVAREVRAFLDRNPEEVLVFVIEDHVTPDRIRAVLDDTGLGGELLAVTAGAPLPTLGAMIDAGTRLLVTLENGDGGPTLPNAFSALVEETPFTFLTTSSLRGPASCVVNRGPASAPVFQLNHWVTPAGLRRSKVVNYGRLRTRVAQCAEVRGRMPTLVAVDFAETSALLDVVRELNRHPLRNEPASN